MLWFDVNSVISVTICFRIISVGGDGMFSETVEGVMSNTVKEAGGGVPTPDSSLPRPKIRFGIIPAGNCLVAALF